MLHDLHLGGAPGGAVGGHDRRAGRLALTAAEGFSSTLWNRGIATVDGRAVAVGSFARLLGDSAHPAAELERVGHTTRQWWSSSTGTRLACSGSQTGSAPVLVTGGPRVPPPVSPSKSASPTHELRNNSAKVSVVGDGVNDAPALAVAQTGLALETADVVVRDELAVIPTVVNLSRRAGTLPLGVAGYEGSTVLVGLDGLCLFADDTWRRACPDAR